MHTNLHRGPEDVHESREFHGPIRRIRVNPKQEANEDGKSKQRGQHNGHRDTHVKAVCAFRVREGLPWPPLGGHTCAGFQLSLIHI
eukprot:4344826-Prymnesium_polylepis.1